MCFGLNTKILGQLNMIFSRFVEIDEVILYGSRAKGNYRNSSDIDITIKGQSLSLEIINKISTRIDDLLLPYTIDLSIYHHLRNKELIEHINRIGKVIYSKSQ
jgi:predicted nucleotidyltransferase